MYDDWKFIFSYFNINLRISHTNSKEKDHFSLFCFKLKLLWAHCFPRKNSVKISVLKLFLWIDTTSSVMFSALFFLSILHIFIFSSSKQVLILYWIQSSLICKKLWSIKIDGVHITTYIQCVVTAGNKCSWYFVVLKVFLYKYVYLCLLPLWFFRNN